MRRNKKIKNLKFFIAEQAPPRYNKSGHPQENRIDLRPAPRRAPQEEP